MKIPATNDVVPLKISGPRQVPLGGALTAPHQELWVWCQQSLPVREFLILLVEAAVKVAEDRGSYNPRCSENSSRDKAKMEDNMPVGMPYPPITHACRAYFPCGV